MPLTITFDLVTGTYDAGDTDDRRQPEWPPHPARLFCALVAAVRTREERDVLLWLEAQDPPTVIAAAEHGSSQSTSYVVTNDNAKVTGKSQTHPGRSHQLKVRARALPASPRVSFVWDQAETDDVVLGHVDAMCRRVPYIGRSTGIATLTAAATLDSAADVSVGDGVRAEGSSQVFEPCDQLEGELMVRVPYAGYLDQLDELHAADRPAWQASRYLYYRAQRPDTTPMVRAVEPSVYRDVVVLRFTSLRPEGRLVTRFTEQLRRRVLAAAGPQAPAVLHGHGADGRPHVAFMALPNVAADLERESAAHADGRLLGLAVAIPDLPASQRRAVLAAVLGLRRRGEGGDLDVVDLELPGFGQVELRYDPGLVRPWGANPERWRLGSTQWVSATPVLLDRYPKRPGQVEQIVRDSVRQVGLPEPVTVQVSMSPLVPGGVALQPVDLPKKYVRRLFRHVSLTFEAPVAGPVMLGAGRYLGLGLLAPVRYSPTAHPATASIATSMVATTESGEGLV
jgi:CRISPR-associated protein Csb2